LKWFWLLTFYYIAIPIHHKMTFDEAVKFKATIEPEFVYKGTPMSVYVTPSKPDDLTIYFADFRVRKMNDTDAKLYSSNNDYIVQGIKHYRDTNHLYWFEFPL
jgi:hypothetical protein